MRLTTSAGSARACMPRAASKLSKDPWWKRTAEVLAACDMAQPKTRSSVYAICLLGSGKRLGLGLAVGLGSRVYTRSSDQCASCLLHRSAASCATACATKVDAASHLASGWLTA
eukprot:scaffold68018_cov68-Phaeocystis_antarctica.AAC.3